MRKADSENNKNAETPPSPANSPPADLLKAVSRSFSLTLRILPAPVRRPIGIAYLLARTSDTIADTKLIDSTAREASLRQLAQAVQSGRIEPDDFAFPPPCQTQTKEQELLDRICESLALLQTVDQAERRLIQEVLQTIIGGQRKERELLHRVGDSVNLLQTVGQAERRLIQDVLQTIIGGQSLDLQRFQNASARNVVCLKSDAELDDYTYRVAGCVGEFWTRICFQKLSANPSPPPELLCAGVRFGKGLQLLNILRDISDDLQQGRCYLPQDALHQNGLSPENLVIPSADETRQKIAPLFQRYAQKANHLLMDGWEYTNQLPRRWVRVRLACAWPVLIGLQTLKTLPLDDPLNPSRRAKISRQAVKTIIAKTLLAHPFPRLWQRLAKPPQKNSKKQLTH